MNNEIVIFENQNIKLEVNVRDETVWLSEAQIAELFDVSRQNINKHIRNILETAELERTAVCREFEHIENNGRKYSRTIYNLDVILSIGYRANSKKAIEFRRWANSILKDYLLKGYAVNEQRLEYLEKTVKLLNIANRAKDQMLDNDAKEVIGIISDYYEALDLLYAYDSRELARPKGNKNKEVITYEDCFGVINQLKYKQTSDIFGVERQGGGLMAILGAVYQGFAGEDAYPTVEEKIANLLYLVIKNHPFVDGNKRIGATLFIYFLSRYGLLFKDGKKIMNNNMLAATTLLIAESKPSEKDIMIDLVMNFLS